MKVEIKKINGIARLPIFATKGDAGFDLFAVENKIIKAGKRELLGTGVAIEIPDGYVGLVWDKSGISNNYGIKTLGGVIDAGYRGEVKIGLINLSDSDFLIEAGNKIAQMLIQKVEHPELVEVDELSNTERGENGFGSTGK